jgi:hypothetical protein
LPTIADSWRPGAHDGERRLAQQELRDAVDHHAPLTVEANLTEGTINAAARVDLDVRGGEQQLDDWGRSLITCCLVDSRCVDVWPSSVGHARERFFPEDHGRPSARSEKFGRPALRPHVRCE